MCVAAVNSDSNCIERVKSGFDDHLFGEEIRSLNADQISWIALEMKNIFSQSIKSEEQMDEQAFEVFKETMTDDFQYGNNSIILNCSSTNTKENEIYLYNYSCEAILERAELMGCKDIRQAIGNQLPADYRIKLHLDVPLMREKGKLIFVVREFMGGAMTSTISFLLDSNSLTNFEAL